MARKYGNVSTAIWRNQDWRSLPEGPQRMYLQLVTQQDISAAGTLALTVKRWASGAADSTVESVVANLTYLQARRYVVFDTDTEELLVRSFVRWDGGYSNPKRKPVIIRAAREVESAKIRATLAAEFERLALPTEGLVDAQADSLSAPHSQGHAATSVAASDAADPLDLDPHLFSQANSLSDSQTDSDAAEDGVVVTKGPYVETTTHNPQPTTLPPSAAGSAARSGEGDSAGAAGKKPTPNEIAFGLARRRVAERQSQGTPVVAGTKSDPLHILRNLILPFANAGYGEDEIDSALASIEEGIPTKQRLERALGRIRRPENEHSAANGYRQGSGNGRTRHQPFRNPEDAAYHQPL